MGAAAVGVVPRAIIFGVEGVLLHAPDPCALESWEQRLGLARGSLTDDIIASPAAWRATLGLVDDADVWMELACLFRLHADEVRTLARDFIASMRVDAALVGFVRSLRSLRSVHPHLRTGLLSNAWPGARARYTETYGLGDVADTIIISAEEQLAKPDTRIYQLAAERLAIAPEDALFVDACQDHVAAARDAGLQGLHVVHRDQLIAGLSRVLELACDGTDRSTFASHVSVHDSAACVASQEEDDADAGIAPRAPGLRSSPQVDAYPGT